MGNVSGSHHALDRQLVVLERLVVLFPELEEGNIRAFIKIAEELDLDPALVEGAEVDLRCGARVDGVLTTT